MRTTLVVLHAAPGVLGLVAGIKSITPPAPADGRSRWRRAYLVCVAVLMGVRIWRAHREAAEQRAGWQRRYVSHIYFTYIALWVGFLIVPAINSPMPQVAVPLATGGVLVVGHVLLTRYQRRLNPVSDGG